MALMRCSECGHEVSRAAIACPNCGSPLAPPAPAVPPKIVAVDNDRTAFPKWIFIPIVILIFLIINTFAKIFDANFGYYMV
jgi:uncharacterized membrane protein YvbJ